MAPRQERKGLNRGGIERRFWAAGFTCSRATEVTSQPEIRTGNSDGFERSRKGEECNNQGRPGITSHSSPTSAPLPLSNRIWLTILHLRAANSLQRGGGAARCSNEMRARKTFSKTRPNHIIAYIYNRV
ncbi:unnamed protein product [Lasius platythorax]|uniref:Uncharacterized protein n=1 Tax=Lasius platythorax TaxID=488582 RepID=A0AAV2PCG8_9HYME